MSGLGGRVDASALDDLHVRVTRRARELRSSPLYLPLQWLMRLRIRRGALPASMAAMAYVDTLTSPQGRRQLGTKVVRRLISRRWSPDPPRSAPRPPLSIVINVCAVEDFARCVAALDPAADDIVYVQSSPDLRSAISDAAAGLSCGLRWGPPQSGGPVLVTDTCTVAEPFAVHWLWQRMERAGAGAVYADEYRSSCGFRYAAVAKPEWSPELAASDDFVGQLVLFRSMEGLQIAMDAPVTHDRLHSALLVALQGVPSVAHASLHLSTRNVDPHELAGASIDEARIRFASIGWASSFTTITAWGTPEVMVDDRVCIVIPTLGAGGFLEPCVRSVFERTVYPRFEVVVVFHGDRLPVRTTSFLRAMGCRILLYPDPRYAFGSMNNFAVQNTDAEFIVCLNDDTEVVSPDWLVSMVRWAQPSRVGAVGARLLRRDGRVGHLGDVIVGDVDAFRHPIHALDGLAANDPGPSGYGQVPRNVTAVTGACLLIRREVFHAVGGYDGRLTSYEDTDLCVRLLDRGYRNVVVPEATLYHFETGSRAGSIDPVEEYASLSYLKAKHPRLLEADSYYPRGLRSDGSFVTLAAPPA